MRFSAASVCIFLFGIFKVQPSAARYAACGNGTPAITEAMLEDNVVDHVTRLMALRNSNYGWENTPEVVMAIQLTRPELFQNRQETMQRLEAELRANVTRMPLGKFSQYILAAEASCENLTDFGGMDLASEVKERMHSEFNYDGIQHIIPRHGWYGFYLALQAYCITQGESSAKFYVRKALHSQSHDGSFGHTHSVDLTSQAMLGLTCLSSSGALFLSLQDRVEASLKLASKFVMSKITSERDKVWISDKYSSPAAVLAIKGHSKWTTEAWRCSLIMKSLNRPHGDYEGESAIAQRLLALKGVSVLELTDENYGCLRTVAVENEEQTVDAKVELTPTSCSLEDDPVFNVVFAPTLIDVHISVRPRATTHDTTKHSGSSHFTLADVTKGKSLLRLMAIARCRGLMTFEHVKTAWGEYITAINGVEANSANKEYWEVSNNGESLTVGIRQFVPSHSDRISFKLKMWQ